jgi:hypothetical protein
MKSSTLFAPLAIAAILASSAAALVACGGDDSNANPQPQQHDSGTGVDGSMTGDSGGNSDSGGNMDSGLPDTGNCVSDAATCNSCYSAMQAAQDPYNACAPSTANCVPFANGTRVPANVPRVP